jgi:hypothetical protein
MDDIKMMERCTVCLQPVSDDYKFKLVYYENGKEIVKWFCGGACLKQWLEKELDKIHLEELETLE